MRFSLRFFSFFLFLGVFALGNDVLVQINDKKITLQDAKEFTTKLLPNTSFDTLTLEQKKMIRNRLIERELFLQTAKKAKIDETKKFQENLKKIKEELMVQTWIESQLDKIIISDSEAREFYNNNKEKFVTKPELNLRHIVFKTEKEAKNAIIYLSSVEKDKLKESFIQLYNEKSQDKKDDLSEDISSVDAASNIGKVATESIAALKNGEITKVPIKSDFGYIVFYLENRSQTQTIPYEVVKKNILAILRQKQFQIHLVEIVKELRAKAKIEDHFDELVKE
ncbi:MAG: peptidyl-prolyl cis-trans isomerase [Campylobacterales bacterium]|nr:peptidyl-prolyl cis-trans isomerase [Campylobacterales bacterium]